MHWAIIVIGCTVYLEPASKNCAEGLALSAIRVGAGVPLLDDGTVRLPQLIGLSRAVDMILTGRAVDAKETLSFGRCYLFL